MRIDRGERSTRVSLKYLTVVVVLLGLPLLAGSSQDELAVEFIHVSDTHVMSLKGVHPKMIAHRQHYKHSSKTFSDFLTRVDQEYRPSFVLHSGDVVDFYSTIGPDEAPVYGQVNRFKLIYERSPMPIYLSLGNHDIQHYRLEGVQDRLVADQFVAGEARAEWIRTISCFHSGSYYSFEKKAGETRYVFLMLDNGYYGSWHLAGSKRTRTFHFAHEQLYWLEKQLELHKDKIIVLAMHVPLTDNPMSQAIQAAIAGRRNVVAAFVGHAHRVDTIEERHVDEGHTLFQVRTPSFAVNESHWRRVRLLEDRIEISFTGKAEEVAKIISLPARLPPTAKRQ